MVGTRKHLPGSPSVYGWQPPEWISLPLSEILKTDLRLDAGVYATEAGKARLRVLNCGHGSVLMSELLTQCSYPGRFRRIYVTARHGQPLLLPSQLDEIKPSAAKFISAKHGYAEALKVAENTVLITRSGTTGNCTVFSKALKGNLLSDDIIRLTTKNVADSGYIYTFLKSRTGKNILRSGNYGSVIQHIEPAHLLQLPVPDAPPSLKEKIHDLIRESFDLRDESNALIDQAQDMIRIALDLPPAGQSDRQDEHRADCFTVNSRDLNGRFEAKYHCTAVQAVMRHLQQNAVQMTTLADKALVKNILLPGRFKRRYVSPEYGIPFIGGKEILQLDPRGDKYLSLKQHGNLIRNQLALDKNTLLVTCSGTVGKVALVPEHWQGWSASQHLLRIIPASDSVAGYLYAWLSSEWALPLIQRHKYGSVIDEIDEHHLSEVAVPLLAEPVMREINRMILESSGMRFKAFRKEQEALEIFNDQVMGEQEEKPA